MKPPNSFFTKHILETCISPCVIVYCVVQICLAIISTKSAGIVSCAVIIGLLCAMEAVFVILKSFFVREVHDPSALRQTSLSIATGLSSLARHLATPESAGQQCLMLLTLLPILFAISSPVTFKLGAFLSWIICATFSGVIWSMVNPHYDLSGLIILFFLDLVALFILQHRQHQYSETAKILVPFNPVPTSNSVLDPDLTLMETGLHRGVDWSQLISNLSHDLKTVRTSALFPLHNANKITVINLKSVLCSLYPL